MDIISCSFTLCELSINQFVALYRSLHFFRNEISVIIYVIQNSIKQNILDFFHIDCSYLSFLVELQ